MRYLSRYLGNGIVEEFAGEVLRLMEDGVFSRTEFRRIFINTHDAKLVEAMLSQWGDMVASIRRKVG